MNREPTANRRRVLGALAGAGTASLAGCSFFESGSDGDTATLADDRARELAERFAPTFYFDTYEQWYPTDPRPYETEPDGEPVVDGFEAFNGYNERYEEPESPPNPTVFYHAVEYEDSPLAVVQFWQYSAFDQFTTNFHWHDWEVLHVFVDTETGEPQLHVASSHSRSAPNNEFLDPDPDRIPAILVELGSHSNALSVNDERDRFRRFPLDDLLPDITNGTIEGIEDIADIPIAYGLPRDEGGRLPFVVPELDGAPVYDHDRLPAVEQADLIDESLVVRSFDALSAPPTDLPERQTGLRFEHGDRDTDSDAVDYDLVPAADLEHITGFTGPQLSFEFSVPDVVENAVSGHITTTGIPWGSPRYENPAADISDPAHRQALAQRYDAIGEPSRASTVVATVTEAVSDDQAPEDEGVTTQTSTVEGVALLESNPEAVPTFAGGVTVLQDVPEGEHRLTVNGAGVAPHSEPLPVDSEADPTPAGVDGEIPLVARENATRLEVDPSDSEDDLAELAVEDDFAGRLYDAPIDGPDAVYVHRGGAYTTEVRDRDDEIGAERVNPDTESAVQLEDLRTGKASLARFLASISEETRASVAAATDDDSDDDDNGGDDNGDDNGGDDNGDDNGGDDNGDDDDDQTGSGNAIQGLERALAAAVESARRAADRAEDGDRGNADAALEAAADRIQRAADRLSEARDSLPDDTARAAGNRLDQAQLRSDQALESDKL